MLVTDFRAFGIYYSLRLRADGKFHEGDRYSGGNYSAACINNRNHIRTRYVEGRDWIIQEMWMLPDGSINCKWAYERNPEVSVCNMKRVPYP